MSMDVNNDIRMAQLEAKIARVDEHVKDWIEITDNQLDVLTKTTRAILEFLKYIIKEIDEK